MEAGLSKGVAMLASSMADVPSILLRHLEVRSVSVLVAVAFLKQMLQVDNPWRKFGPSTT
jgi:hypothetical protein